jgi:hypothetical protein
MTTMRSQIIPSLCSRYGSEADASVLQISSRKVMQQVLQQNSVPPEAFSPVCVIVDKVDKIGKEKVGPLTQCAAPHTIRSCCWQASAS